jgi:hypothetical protein
MLYVVALSACAPEIAVVPMGQPVASSGPITLTAFASEWTGSPEDLPEYITPIAVDLFNAGPYEVRVSYADFALRDERGFRYGAINPFIPAQLGQAQAEGTLVASRGSHFSGFSRGSGSSHSYSRSGVTVGPPSGRRGYGTIGSHGGGWSGYYVGPGARGWYGAGWNFWGGPFLYPPWYSRFVFFWGPGYYPSERPSRDVIDAALPEGVLAPGGRVNGYLYFQKATDRSRRLDISWEARDARTQVFVGAVHVPLEVVER